MDPTYVTARYNLAKILQHMGRWEEAKKHLQQVIVAEPQNASAHYDLGRSEQMLGEFEQAKSSLEQATALDASMYAAYYRLGSVAAAMAQPKDADRHFRKSIEINPRFVKAFAKLGLLYLNHDYAELADAVLDQGIAIDETEAELFALKGLAAQQQGNYAEAIDNLKQALEMKPQLYETLFNLGMAYAAYGKLDEAKTYLERFAAVAQGKEDIDPSYISAAREKIMAIESRKLQESSN